MATTPTPVRAEPLIPPRELSFAGFGEMTGSKIWRASSPAALGPQTEAIEIEIDDRRGVEGQRLADEQPADDRNAQRATQLRAFTKGDRQWQRPEHRRHRRHHDRAEAF